jgi:alpha-galactosidase
MQQAQMRKGVLLMKAKMKLMLLAVLMAILAGPALASQLAGELGILTPETLAGNNPATGAPWVVGDQYRLVFHTSATTAATSADIATYNAWVQGLADASPLNIGAIYGATWKVIGSTAAVDARDNTSTNPAVNGSGHAIFLLDGSTLVAINYADLWDGAIQNIINITEQGTTWAYWPWTGTLTDGTAGTGGSAGNPLGSTGQVGQGNASSTTDWVWRVWTMDPPEYLMPMYALSDPLVIILAGATNPSPANGTTVPAGDVDLSWTNLPPNVGSDVWVDVWFGTDPVTDFTKVVDAGLNTTSVTVNAPVADTYYWQVNSYVDGSPTGDPIQGNVWIFYVDDTDGDGLPDAYELLYTNPPSPTALNPGDDLEPDGLTNMEEYNLGTEPDNPDTDGDTLLDGDELAGAGLRPPTDPLDADTDDDTLDDGVETNTGTFVSSTDTGTDPTNVDSDGDGLSDGVETGTGVFVDENDTGTDPTVLDSDSDSAEDWYEVAAAYTDPTDPGDSPVIPYPLPDPDGSTGNSNPVKVYIMSGQSNMVGFGRVGGTELGTLNTITNVENKFPNLVDEVGAWTVRNDVKYRGVISAIGDDVLMPGFGANSSSFGPELGFGHVMGYHHDEPVLLIKTSIGNRSLGWDCLPPGSPRFDYNGYTYAGYGDGTGSWPIGEEPDPPVPGEWYAGKQYDEYFMDEADWAPAAGSPVFNVTDILDNFASEYPEYATQGFEIAGFVWWQGHKDQGEPYASRYEFNMVNFIKKLRQYYENRYPANIDPNAPFVLATIAFGGWDLSGAGLIVANAQLAVSGETGNYPEFAGNVKTMEARGYWRDFGPSTQGYHYNHNAETYMLVGDALGRAMVELISGGPPPDTEPPTPNPATFASPPAAVSDTEITMTATTGSDATGPVEYYFDEISGNPGGTDSGWTTDPVYNDTGLNPSTQYTYTVQMRDAVTPVPNVGTASSPASATTDPAPAVPAAPSNLSATAISKTRIDLSWTDNADNETGFKIERSRRVNTNFTQIDTVGQDVTSYSDTTVRKNTLYYYRVRATNEYGDSDYSNEASARTPK